MLHNFVYYDKRTGQITGQFRTSTPGLLPEPPSPDCDQVEVTDEEHRKLLGSVNATREVLEGRVRDGRVTALTLKPRFEGRLEIACDCEDRDGDGVPELPADGASVAHVQVRVVDRDGRVIKERPARVTVRVTRGSLSARGFETKDGAAEVQWRAPAETTQAQMIVQSQGFERASLTLEFIPPDEHRALSRRKPGRERE